MSDRMTVHRDGKPIYDIVMEENYDKLGKEVAALSVQERRLCVVTDSTVAELYSETVIRQLEPVCKEVHLFVFEAGEKNKNLDTVRKLYEFLIQNHYDRNDMLVALGGGRRPLRLYGCHLFKRNPLYPGADHAALPGGFQHWRKNRGRF